MSTTTIDPSEFVKSYTAERYKAEIKAWNKAITPSALINFLRAFKAPKAVFVEIGIALAEEVLQEFEKRCPKDRCPHRAIKAAKAWLNNRTEANAQAARVRATEVYEISWACATSNDAVSSTYAARTAAWAAHAAEAETPVDAAYNTDNALAYALAADLPPVRALDIIKEVGYRYYTFLKQN
jgi:hypothetical protein